MLKKYKTTKEKRTKKIKIKIDNLNNSQKIRPSKSEKFGQKHRIKKVHKRRISDNDDEKLYQSLFPYSIQKINLDEPKSGILLRKKSTMIHRKAKRDPNDFYEVKEKG